MSRSIYLLPGLFLLFIAIPASAVDGKSCESQSAKLKPSERSAFMKSCLDQLASPPHVKEVEQQNKKALCEQNAKNQHLQGGEQSSYVASCMTQNEAAEAAKAAPAKVAEAKPQPAKSKAKHAAAKAASKSDANQHKKTAKQHKHKAEPAKEAN